MHFLRAIVITLSIVGQAACSSVSQGGGSNTSWVSCGTSSDCDVGHPCVDHRCQGQPAASAVYGLEVFVSLSFDQEKQSPTIAWLGGSPMAATRSLHLATSFDSADAARAFDGTFVVSLTGAEAGRETVHFTDCDAVADLGLDPRSIRSVVERRSLNTGQLSTDTFSNAEAPYGCYLNPPPSPPVLTGPRRILLRIPSNQRLTFSYGGKDLPPRGVQHFASRNVWELLIEPNDDGGALGAVDISSGGQSIGSIPLSFEPCTGIDTKPIIEEQLWLELDADAGTPSARIDPFGGVECLNTDGTGTSAIP